MAKRSYREGSREFFVDTEFWDIDGRKVGVEGRVVVEKVATRDGYGRFHGATNFLGTVQPL